ncbi:antirestriction protein ArdA [Nocardia alni]|uniref:antirestriction protein ArdA n=1 Tax=Nocardia alni TaxID=2815723 RepID=UPI001C246F8C|nr:antirestriction protein ArdA [Nocardia alni]
MSEKFPNKNVHNAYRAVDDQAAADNEAQHCEAETSYEQDPLRYPRIYVTAGLPLRAELTKGTWLDMARDPDYISAELYAVLGEPVEHGADRFYIWNAEGFGVFDVSTGAIGLDDVHSLELLSKVANGIVDFGPAFAAWASVYEDDPTQFNRFERAYKGHFESMADYVRQLFKPLQVEDLLRQAAPEGLQEYVYVDYAAVGEEMAGERDIVAFPADGGGVWVFEEGAQ